MSAVRLRLSPFVIDTKSLYLIVCVLVILFEMYKGFLWISWNFEAMKGVVTNEMFRGVGNKL